MKKLFQKQQQISSKFCFLDSEIVAYTSAKITPKGKKLLKEIELDFEKNHRERFVNELTELQDSALDKKAIANEERRIALINNAAEFTGETREKFKQELIDFYLNRLAKKAFVDLQKGSFKYLNQEEQFFDKMEKKYAPKKVA